MEKRPPAGIWGGLWCFHEIDDMEKLPALLASLKLKSLELQELTPFRHTFSHFHLDIQPIVADCQYTQLQEINEKAQQQWYDLQTEASVGLAASTQKLISLLKQL